MTVHFVISLFVHFDNLLFPFLPFDVCRFKKGRKQVMYTWKVYVCYKERDGREDEVMEGRELFEMWWENIWKERIRASKCSFFSFVCTMEPLGIELVPDICEFTWIYDERHHFPLLYLLFLLWFSVLLLLILFRLFFPSPTFYFPSVLIIPALHSLYFVSQKFFLLIPRFHSRFLFLHSLSWIPFLVVFDRKNRCSIKY